MYKSNLILIEKEIYDELASATMGFIVKFFEKGQIRVLLSGNDHLIEFQLIEIVFYHLIEIMLIT
jgi:hypothetical protein